MHWIWCRYCWITHWLCTTMKEGEMSYRMPDEDVVNCCHKEFKETYNGLSPENVKVWSEQRWIQVNVEFVQLNFVNFWIAINRCETLFIQSYGIHELPCKCFCIRLAWIRLIYDKLFIKTQRDWWNQHRPLCCLRRTNMSNLPVPISTSCLIW